MEKILEHMNIDSMAPSFGGAYMLDLLALRWTKLGLDLQILAVVSQDTKFYNCQCNRVRKLTCPEWMPGNPAILNASAVDIQQATSVSVDSAVQIPEEDGEGYMVTLEVFHHIHCLVSIPSMTTVL